MATKSAQVQFNEKLREISKEVSEFVPNDPNNPEAGQMMVSKAEALCRNLFKMALGYTTKKKLKDGKETEVIHHPEKWAMKEIMDRVDGRTVAAAPADDRSAPIADRIRQSAKDLVNQAAEVADDSNAS